MKNQTPTPEPVYGVPKGMKGRVESAAPELPPSSAPTAPLRTPLEPRAGVDLVPDVPPPAPARALRMLDLFSGTGSASRAAAVRGWAVIRVDNAPGTAADVRADIRTWSPPLGPWDLVWASPPCTQLSTANNKTRDVEAGMECIRAALKIIAMLQPRWWVLENVHGATTAIGKLIGPPVARYGSFYLWGVFPPFAASVPRNKTKLSGRRRAERRAAIPWLVSDGLIRACESLAVELEVANG